MESILEMLTASMTDEQKDLLDAYLDARCKAENIVDFDRFPFALHFGAQIMAELIKGKGGICCERIHAGCPLLWQNQSVGASA